MNINAKGLNFVLGLIVVLGSFLVVFGAELKNLKIDKEAQQNNSLVVETPTTTKTQTTTSNATTPKTSSSASSGSTSSSSSGSTTNTTTSGGYTMTQISSHNSATTCWSAINGYVYDLTDWVDSHPGGRSTILMICGKDGSALFNMQHGNQSGPKNILASYEIGTLSS